MTAFGAFEDIVIGATASVVKKITAADIQRFVELTGDDNPLHVNEEYARTTSFKEVVVHGMLGASFISTVIGTRLPGPGALWVSQEMDFLLPVRLDDVITVTCTVIGKQDSQRLLQLETSIVNQHQQRVLSGQGTVKVLQQVTPRCVEETEHHRKVALVTGGSGGIGHAICKKLADDGFNIVINYCNSSDRATALATEINNMEVSAAAIEADIATEEGASYLYDAALKRFGGVSVLINNAAPRIIPKPYASLCWSDIQKQIDVQLRGMFTLTQACLPLMAERGYGRIISLTSQEIDGEPTAHWTAYGLAKNAVATLTRYIALEYGPHGVTANCVAPGMTETRMIGDVPEKTQLMVARRTPVRRLALPEDIASAVAYLASHNACHVTGHTLRVNGGSVML